MQRFAVVVFFLHRIFAVRAFNAIKLELKKKKKRYIFYRSMPACHPVEKPLVKGGGKNAQMYLSSIFESSCVSGM